MKPRILALSALVLLTGCSTTAPATPTEAYLNRYAGAEAVAMNCPAYGGYGSVSAMRSDAEKNLARAKALGAREADIAKARQRAQSTLTGAAILVGPMEACSSFVNSLAWAGTSEPKLQARAGKSTKPQLKKI